MLAIPFAWSGNAPSYTTSTRNDLDHSGRVPLGLARSCSLGIDSHFPADARPGAVLDRLSHRAAFSEAGVMEGQFSKYRPALAASAESTKTPPTCQSRSMSVTSSG